MLKTIEDRVIIRQIYAHKLPIILLGSGGVYKITCKISNRIYIGSSCTLEKRIWEHITCLHSNTHSSTHLQRAWNKYGEENFVFEVLEECNPEDCILREQYYLDTLLFAQEYIRKENNRFKKLGYNINPLASSRRGSKTSNKTKRLLSSIRQGKGNSFYGKTHSITSIQKAKTTRERNNSDKSAIKVKVINIATKEETVFNRLRLAAYYYNVSYNTLRYKLKIGQSKLKNAPELEFYYYEN